jgi:LmbE family N-acetylglucosaminyl deacetylase
MPLAHLIYSMRVRLVLAFAAATAVAAVSPIVNAATGGHSGHRPHVAPVEMTIPDETRLLVIAPHPDDEVLAAGGLMQRVHAKGGTVRVVYLTNGEGYPEGVELEEHGKTLTPGDFRDYGRRREREAHTALAALKIGDYETAFLSFPDGGLAAMMRRYWSERRSAYRSPYTRRDRPPESKLLVPETEYRGEDLTQELAQTIGDFRPTMIAVPRKEDQHEDHCAAWFFLADALADVRRVHPEYSVDVINYIVHWYSWPFENDDSHLDPPPHLRGGVSGWMTLPLSRAEAHAKHDALRRYQTQMHVMRWFLDGFARANEVFSRPGAATVVLPVRRNLCDES